MIAKVLQIFCDVPECNQTLSMFDGTTKFIERFARSFGWTIVHNGKHYCMKHKHYCMKHQSK